MPMTSLAAQLKKLEAPQSNLLAQSQHKTRASFLFESKVAARFDRDTFYDIGLSGLEELKTLNPQFSNFLSTLFDPASKSLERAVETSEANEKLNCHIKNFLTLLSPYFLVTASHRALEWLINRYHIQDFNTDDVMFLILPYHETLLFAKMLQLLPIREQTGKWHWLYQVKKEGVPLSKTALLNRASKDMGFLKFVCDMPAEAIKISGSKAGSLGTLLAFYCTTAIGALENADVITENHISNLLPSLIAALGSSLPDFTASAFMIIARLATKACLGNKILEALFNKISKVSHAKLRSETTLVLVLLSQNMQKKIVFPEKGLKRLSESKWFIPSLATLTKNKILTVPLVCSLLRTSLQIISSTEDPELKNFIQNLLNKLHIDDADAKQIFRCLLEEFDKETCQENTVVWYSGLFRDLEKSFPKVFDDTVSTALTDRLSKEAAAVETLLGVNTSRNDIYERLVHPNENIRVDTIRKISKEFEPDQLGWLRQPLLERFKDESKHVVKALLKMPSHILNSMSPHDVFIDNLLVAVSNFGATDKEILKGAVSELVSRAEKEYAARVFIALLPHILLIAECKALERVEPLPWFSFFKEATKECEDRQKLLWDLLNNRTLIPSFSKIYKTFRAVPMFKKKGEYWSSAALLLAFAIQDEPDKHTVTSVMDFLILYIGSNKVSVDSKVEIIGPVNIATHISSCGEMSINNALHCLNVLASKSLRDRIHEKTQWIDFSKGNSALILSIYKIIHKGVTSSKANIKNTFLQAQRHFLQSYFKNDELRINFLLYSLVFDPSLGHTNVSAVNSILRDNDAQLMPSLLAEESLVVPAAFSLLSSIEPNVRNETLQFFNFASNTFSSGFYKTLVGIVLEHSNELKLDPEQIVVVAYSTLSPTKEIKKTHSPSKRNAVGRIVNKLFDIIIANETPIYFKRKLLEILEFVQSEELFLKTCPMALSLIGEKSTNGQKGKVLHLVLKRFNETSVGVLKSDEAWSFLDKALSDQKNSVKTNGEKLTSPSSIIINQVTRELYDSIPEPKNVNQQKFLSLVIKWVTDSENAQVVSSAASMFKKISLDCQIIVNLLKPMLTVEPPEQKKSPGQSQVLKPRRSIGPPLEVLEMSDWKRGVRLLEMIQNKKKMSKIHLLLPSLFDILKRSLQFEHQNAVEYPKQLLLSTILFCCEKLVNSNNIALTPENLQVDLVVDCIRASHNPQTHHHALLALTYLAKIIPEQILHNIMAIFTFIGSSVLRQDDAYSFQIISQIIDTIIPVLISIERKGSCEVTVSGILRVFVAAFLDIPEHRRLPLLHKLMVTLNDGKYLWIFLALVFESHVTNPITTTNDIEIKDIPGMTAVPKRLETSLELCAKFSPQVILNTCCNLLLHLNELPHDKEEIEGDWQMNKLTSSIFNVKENSGKQLRHYKFTMLTFLSSLLSSSEFVLQMADQPNEVIGSMQDVFSVIVNQNLLYLKAVLQQVDATAQLPTSKFWKAILGLIYEVLDKINALLPTDLFLKVVKNLLNSEIEAIRRKAMELLGWRLQDPRRPVLQKTLFGLLGPFTTVLSSLSDENALLSQEQQLTVQTALITLKLMARQLASVYVVEFKQVLTKLSDILVNGNIFNWPVLGSLILCAGELISLLKSTSIAVLPQLVPVLINHLKNREADEGGDLFLISVITAIQKIVDSLAQFLSPYLPKLLYQIGGLSAKYDGNTAENSKSPQLSVKLKTIRQKLSSEVANRVLVPAVSTTYVKFVKREQHSAIPPLMSILSASIKSGHDLTVELTEFFLKALAFRSEHPNLKLDVVDEVESSVISVILTLTLKLSEAGFRPFYSKIFEWANRGNQAERFITFYRLSLRLAESLKNLFNLFAGIFVENSSELLRLTNVNEEPEGYFQDLAATEKTCILAESVIATLYTVFLHDSHNFVNKERFTLIMKPLVDQIENQIGGEEAWNNRCRNLIAPCVAQMATSMCDDSSWKQLNHHILLKTRHKDYKIRLASVRTVCALARKLGEDFLPLLPETVPFLAELLEDDVEEVEKECQLIVNEMEDILGEPIQKYF